MVKPMVHSTKHIVNNSLFAISAGAITNIQPVVAVNVSDKNLATEVEEGCSIKAIYVEQWLMANSATKGSGVVTVEKLPAGAPLMTAAQSAALDAYPNKKNILFTSQGLYPPNTQNPLPVLRHWIKIPKGKQRFGLGDKLLINMLNQTEGTVACGLSIFKEYL